MITCWIASGNFMLLNRIDKMYVDSILRYDVASHGNGIPTFRGIVMVPLPRHKMSYHRRTEFSATPLRKYQK